MFLETVTVRRVLGELERPYGGATYPHFNLQTLMMDALIARVAEIIA